MLAELALKLQADMASIKKAAQTGRKRSVILNLTNVLLSSGQTARCTPLSARTSAQYTAEGEEGARLETWGFGSVGGFFFLDLDLWLDHNVGTERIGYVALLVGHLGESQDALLLCAGTNHYARPQRNPG